MSSFIKRSFTASDILFPFAIQIESREHLETLIDASAALHTLSHCFRIGNRCVTCSGESSERTFLCWDKYEISALPPLSHASPMARLTIARRLAEEAINCRLKVLPENHRSTLESEHLLASPLIFRILF